MQENSRLQWLDYYSKQVVVVRRTIQTRTGQGQYKPEPDNRIVRFYRGFVSSGRSHSRSIQFDRLIVVVDRCRRRQ